MLLWWILPILFSLSILRVIEFVIRSFVHTNTYLNTTPQVTGLLFFEKPNKMLLSSDLFWDSPIRWLTWRD